MQQQNEELKREWKICVDTLARPGEVRVNTDLVMTCGFSDAATLQIDLPHLLENLDMTAAQVGMLQDILATKGRSDGRRQPRVLSGAELATLQQQRAAMVAQAGREEVK